MPDQTNPELEQTVKVPDYIVDALKFISTKFSDSLPFDMGGELVLISPFDDSGQDCKNDVFEARAYSRREELPYNFRWEDFQASWYKKFPRK